MVCHCLCSVVDRLSMTAQPSAQCKRACHSNDRRPVTPNDSAPYNVPVSDFGQRLRAARRKAGLSQTQLAHEIGVSSHAAIGGWERGENFPSYENLLGIRKTLKVRVDDLMFGDAFNAEWARQMKAHMYPGAENSKSDGRVEQNRLAVDRILSAAQSLSDTVLNALATTLEAIKSESENSEPHPR